MANQDDYEREVTERDGDEDCEDVHLYSFSEVVVFFVSVEDIYRISRQLSCRHPLILRVGISCPFD